jgi:hypothetical protein
MRWSDADIDSARSILSLFPKSEWKTAVGTISHLLGREVTYKALANAFEGRGLGTPRSYCGEQYEEVDVSELEEERPTIEMAAVSDELERILIVPDCHHRAVDPVAWAVALGVGRFFKPHRIVVLGDFVDNHSTSRHAKDPNRDLQLADEIEAANAALDQLDALGAIHKHYLEGNHEENLERYLMEKAPALFNVVSMRKLLRLDERGWSFTRYRQHLKIGKVFYVHDTGSSGATAHVKSRDAFGGSVVQGHTHHAGASYAGTAKGDAHVGISSGWLGRFDDANYAHDIQKRRSWMHAITLGWMEPDGVTHLQLVPIINGKACVNGQLVTAEAA